MDLLNRRGSFPRTGLLLVAALAAAPAGVHAQEDAIERLSGTTTEGNLNATGRSNQPTIVPEVVLDETTMGVSAVVGGDYNTHFVSYGFDIWGAGSDFGENATFNPYAEVSLDFGEVLPDGFAPLVATVGVWTDINNNAPDTIGGDLQEVDVYYSLGSGYGDFSVSVTYQQWIYAGDVEQVLDLGIAYDDSGLYGEDSGFALNPSVLIHKRLAGDNANFEDGFGNPRSSNGFAYLLGVEPAFELIANEAFPLSASIPVTVAFGDDEFYAEAGFAYVSVGAQFAVPLSFIPTDLGEWGLGFGITYYHTDEDAIPTNVDEDFLTGNVGLSLAF